MADVPPLPPRDDGFANEPIDLTDVPRLDEEEFAALDPRYRTGWLGVLAVAAVVTATAAGLGMWLSTAPTVFGVIGGCALLLLALTAVLWSVELKRLGYLLRDHDVSFRSGVLTHRVATVPFVRVQHVSVRRGPFERALGLATVDVSSAGPDISIPGLAIDDAERIKQLITERAGVDSDEPADPPMPSPLTVPPSGVPLPPPPPPPHTSR